MRNATRVIYFYFTEAFENEDFLCVSIQAVNIESRGGRNDRGKVKGKEEYKWKKIKGEGKLASHVIRCALAIENYYNRGCDSW